MIKPPGFASENRPVDPADRGTSSGGSRTYTAVDLGCVGPVPLDQ